MSRYWWTEHQNDNALMRVAVFQGSCSTDGNVSSTVEQIDFQAKRAKEEFGAQLLVVPEVFLSGYGLDPETTKHSAEFIVQIKIVAYFQNVAQQYSIALLICYPELVGEKIYNSATLINRHGEILLTYRKTHLWAEKERALYTEGDELSPVVEVDGVRIGVMICYDIEISEVARCLALRGAQLLLAPTALGKSSVNETIVRHVVSTRALENHVWIAYANHAPPQFLGLSRIVGPDGEVLSSVEDDPLITADLIPSQYKNSLRSIPYLADRRPTLYSAITNPSYLAILPEDYKYTGH